MSSLILVKMRNAYSYLNNLNSAEEIFNVEREPSLWAEMIANEVLHYAGNSEILSNLIHTAIIVKSLVLKAESCCK